jgi:hypothetical protein
MADEIMPRCSSGTSSAIAAVAPAVAAFRPSVASSHASPTVHHEPCPPVSSNPAANTTVPPAIQTRRRPNRERVRSHSTPNSGSVMIAATPVRPLTRPKSRTLCAESSASNWFGSTSWTGARYAIQ